MSKGITDKMIVEANHWPEGYQSSVGHLTEVIRRHGHVETLRILEGIFRVYGGDDSPTGIAFLSASGQISRVVAKLEQWT